QAVNQTFAGQDFYTEEKLDGNYYEISTLPLRDDQDNIYSVLTIYRNINTYKMIQEELQMKIAALEKSNENLQQFAYVASHDLQEPLRKIRAFGDRLSTRYQDVLDATGQDYIRRMQNAAARMQVLINDLLKFSRVARKMSFSNRLTQI
ncbi:MAG: hypothetical protein HC880_14380, partial [Bacteroidia bacterium]|nr:hypothetical protein [Bacteroidia bacterium]